MTRILHHPILNFIKGNMVTFYYNGNKMKGFENEPIAAALHANGIRMLHESAVKHRPRGLFCAIGNCSSCLMRVNGIPNVRVCVEPLKEGMYVESQNKRVKPVETNKWKNESISGNKNVQTDILIVGGGPAGMCAAIEAANFGKRVLLVDRNSKLGGQLIKQTHKFFGSEKQKAGTRGITIAQNIQEEINSNSYITIWRDTTAIGYYHDGIMLVETRDTLVSVKAEAIIIATGASEKNLVFPNNDLPGICGAGAVQTLMNMEGILPGDNILMVGAGNIGLIVSYQLLQAGVNVVAVIEATSKIGGYEVHAAKLRRAGVPIFTGYTVKYAYGDNTLQGAVICALDKNWKQIPGTEKNIKADVMCMAVGLSPLTELFFQAGCMIKYIPELGGYVPAIDAYRRTNVKGIYAAGDASGIEEASSAMLTGHMAALSAVNDMQPFSDFLEKYQNYSEQLLMLRSGGNGSKILSGIKRLRQEEGVNYEK